jgi:hypothetical protein
MINLIKLKLLHMFIYFSIHLVELHAFFLEENRMNTSLQYEGNFTLPMQEIFQYWCTSHC